MKVPDHGVAADLVLSTKDLRGDNVLLEVRAPRTVSSTGRQEGGAGRGGGLLLVKLKYVICCHGIKKKKKSHFISLKQRWTNQPKTRRACNSSPMLTNTTLLEVYVMPYRVLQYSSNIIKKRYVAKRSCDGGQRQLLELFIIVASNRVLLVLPECAYETSPTCTSQNIVLLYYNTIIRGS